MPKGLTMTPLLPQNDPGIEDRKNELAREQAKYSYNYLYLPPLAMAAAVPFDDYPTLDWFVLVARRAFDVLINTLEGDFGKQGTYQYDGRLLELKELIEHPNAASIEKTIGAIIRSFEAHVTRSAPSSLEDYNKLFRFIALPAISQTFQEDAVFASMRVAGPNPLVIERLSKLDDRFPVTDAQYQEVMGSQDSLAAAGQEGRLYLADYAAFDGVLNGSFPSAQKYLAAPLALFAVPQSGAWRGLAPVAIQCAQRPGPRNPIITPSNSDVYNWVMAKSIVQTADGNFHEAVSHLGRTHLVTEPFVIATERQLASTHPVGILLRPHFEGTLFINNAAQEFLIAAQDGVDALLAATIDADRVYAAKSVQNYVFNDAMLPTALKLRGVDDPTHLPVYPYRDDALLIWNVIHKWASDYLAIYYRTDTDVQADFELQNWVAELLSHDGGRIQGVGQDGRVQTRDYLADAVTLIIFTASAQHAAVNYPQSFIMSYAPAMPLAGYAPAPSSARGATLADYLSLLPSLDQAQKQLNITYILGSVYYTRLGDYPTFADARVQAPLQAFQKALQQIEEMINQRNQERPPYEFLLPSKIPQSINI
jgi:arachidonate 15-lipoxygenase